MLPWKTIITIDKKCNQAIYVQVSNAIIREIKRGIIKPNTKMPGTRAMSVALGLNRQTIVRAYDELYAQAWLVSLQTKGTFVNNELPEIHPRPISKDGQPHIQTKETGYPIQSIDYIHLPNKPLRHITGFHDGPDVRLIPVDLLTRGYKRVLQRKTTLPLLSYVEVEGRPFVRESISSYLNASRGLQTTAENIIMTRGSQMSIFLLAQTLLSKGDIVVTASIGYRYADLTFMHAGVDLMRVTVDDDGIDVDEIEQICTHTKIRAVYVTSHHHFPTTVTLCAARRMKLLAIAEKYNFVIIEDDYDYEFHYESSPILPLASADTNGMVAYIGSFSKTLSPGIRIGYISAPENLIQEISKLRQIVDVQGDPVMEQVVAEMIQDGEINRHMKKAVKAYRKRRDFMCEVLRDKFKDVIDFKTPEGGLSIWARFHKDYNVPKIAENLRKKDIILSKGTIHDPFVGGRLNATRMGFGWMNTSEAEVALNQMYKAVCEVSK